MSQAVETVKGVVTDEKGEPLPGVFVTVKGTVQGVVTGIDGSYEIRNVPQRSILVFAFVGFVKQEVQLDGQSVVNIRLREANEVLDEIVIVGYGQQKKVTLTGSVSSVSTKELLQSPVSNISNALAGRLTGIMTVQNSGEPASDAATIWVRG